MKKIILTSSGFDNKNIEKKFLELINKPKKNINVLFIPTAAITHEQKLIIPLCKNELLKAGILEENITTYNLDKNIIDNISKYNVIYVCGGDPKYLLSKFNEQDFYKTLKKFWANGGVYLGVSAGSIVLANNFENKKSELKFSLDVHCEKGSHNGILDMDKIENIQLTDNQAILIINDDFFIIE